MRNLFDQYKHPENRLTHALMTSLHEDRDLLVKFIEWATGKPAPPHPLTFKVLEQSLPGADEPQEAEGSEADGLPDGCIYDENGWALLIESKIAAPLKTGQLRSHRLSAKKHDLTDIDLLALVVNKSKCAQTEEAAVKQWTELYTWLGQHTPESKWPGRLIAYMEVLEAKLSEEGYLKEGALTVFTGVPFNNDIPYNYLEAKRLIRLAMDGLRTYAELKRELGVDLQRPGHTAIKGKDRTGIWDIFWLEDAKDRGNFTEVPHLNLSIEADCIRAFVVLPHNARGEFRQRLLNDDWDGFKKTFEDVLKCFESKFKSVEGAVPCVLLLQRHYRHIGAEPIVDAELQFDLRTAFGGGQSVKPQSEWLKAAYDALVNKSSNIELLVGVVFRYAQCRKDVNSPEILNHIANAWLSCKPLIRKMVP